MEGAASLMILVQLAWVFVVNADCSIIKYTPHVAKSLAWFAYFQSLLRLLSASHRLTVNNLSRVLRILNNLRPYQYLPNVFWIWNENRAEHGRAERAGSVINKKGKGSSISAPLPSLSSLPLSSDSTLATLQTQRVNSLKICCHTEKRNMAHTIHTNPQSK